jgi:N-acetylglucosamine-6-phosphate deacetylase
VAVVLAGGNLVLPDRVLPSSSLVITGSRIDDVVARATCDLPGATVIDVRDHYVVPGFVDVHVHGIEGYDTLDGGDAVAAIAARLPRYGVTAFAPTTVACAPDELGRFLGQVRSARATRAFGAARVLPAHLESNFVNPEYRGAQPIACLRRPPGPDDVVAEGEYSGAAIVETIARFQADVGIVTLAPELPGGLDLIRRLVAAGHVVSLGHSGADVDTANAAIDAGATHATHLFNRMTPLAHRAPGLAGAVLARHEVAAELICDGYHVHPVMSALAIQAKGVDRVMAITDGTAVSGLAPGMRAQLGGREIRAGAGAAFLDDGTMAGSTLTMDRALATIVGSFGRSLVDAVRMCSTTPARQLGLIATGVIAAGATADLVVLDRGYRVVRTLIDGVEAYAGGR